MARAGVPPVWLDGRLVDAQTAPGPSSSAAGVFETLRGERGELFFLAEHLARLAHGAHALGLPWPPPFDLRAALGELACALEPGEFALRLQWGALATNTCQLLAQARPVVAPPTPVTLQLAPPGAVELLRPFGTKTTLRGGYDALRERARAGGAWEALVQTKDGELVEGTRTNVFVAAAGELATPPLAAGALPGILRAALLTEFERAPVRDARGGAWRVVERPLTSVDLFRAEELLLTNSIVRLSAVDRLLTPVGDRCDLPGADGALARVLRRRLVAQEAERGTPFCFRGAEPA